MTMTLVISQERIEVTDELINIMIMHNWNIGMPSLYVSLYVLVLLGLGMFYCVVRF